MEAIERGELGPLGSKRLRKDDGSIITRGKGQDRSRGFPRGRGRGRGRPSASNSTHTTQAARPRSQTRLSTNPVSIRPDFSTEEDSGSGSDIDPEQDILSSKLLQPEEALRNQREIELIEPEAGKIHCSLVVMLNLKQSVSAPKPLKRRPPKQPVGRIYDPLIDQPSLLQKVSSARRTTIKSSYIA